MVKVGAVCLLGGAFFSGFMWFFWVEEKAKYSRSLQHHFGTVCLRWKVLGRSFVVSLRKIVPQNHNLKTAAELGVGVSDC